MKYLVTLLLLLSTNIADAQLVNKWIEVYSTANTFNESSTQNSLLCLDKDNFLLIDRKNWSSPNLVVTNNGGEKWDVIFQSTTNEYQIKAIAYPSKDRFVWVGDTIDYKYSNGQPTEYCFSGIIMTSSDAGKTWNKTKLDTNTTLDNVVMLNENIGIANSITNVNIFYDNYIYHDTLIFTTDFFKTYSKIALPDTLTYIKDIFMFSLDNFIIKTLSSYYGTSKYLETTDRGVSWTEFMDAINVSDLSFVDRQNAYKIEQSNILFPSKKISKIYKTNDGGKTWQFCYTPSDDHRPDYSVVKISAFDENHALAVGTNCAVVKTSNGGATWGKDFVPNLNNRLTDRTPTLNYVAYPHPDCAYFGGDQYLCKMTTEKLLSRPMLNCYSDKIHPNGIKLFWEPVIGAKRYTIQFTQNNNTYYLPRIFDNLLLDTTLTETSLELPYLDYNKYYHTRIKAESDDIESEWEIRSPMFSTLTSDDYTEAPIFISPIHETEVYNRFVGFKWHSVYGAITYQFQASTNSYFNQIVMNVENLRDTIVSSPELMYDMIYYARVKVSYGSKITEWRTISFKIYDPTLSIDVDVSDNLSISVYPNPASDFVEISFKPSDGFVQTDFPDMQIYNSYGESVATIGISPDLSSQRIDISHLPAGVYIINIGSKFEKFMVVR